VKTSIVEVENVFIVLFSGCLGAIRFDGNDMLDLDQNVTKTFHCWGFPFILLAFEGVQGYVLSIPFFGCLITARRSRLKSGQAGTCYYYTFITKLMKAAIGNSTRKIRTNKVLHQTITTTINRAQKPPEKVCEETKKYCPRATFQKNSQMDIDLPDLPLPLTLLETNERFFSIVVLPLRFPSLPVLSSSDNLARFGVICFDNLIRNTCGRLDTNIATKVVGLTVEKLPWIDTQQSPSKVKRFLDCSGIIWILSNELAFELLQKLQTQLVLRR
jgi:hypothetical protein